MRDIKLFNIQLLDLELFLNVAKYSSFTKAGEKMFMTQSVVSKRINQIERELGLTLFIRSKRKVILTPAGRVLSERLRNISEDILDAIEQAHVAQTGASGSLSIGFLEWGNFIFINKLQEFIEKNPQVSVSIYRKRFSELSVEISQGRMDLIFTTSYDCDQFSSSEYEIFKVQKVPVLAYMSKNHRLAKCEQLTMEDIRAESMLMVDEKSSTGYGKYVKELFAKYNINPRISQYAHDGGEHVGNIVINRGILLASGNFLANSLEDEIARVPIKDEYTYITAVWRKNNKNIVLMKFLQEITKSVENLIP